MSANPQRQTLIQLDGGAEVERLAEVASGCASELGLTLGLAPCRVLTRLKTPPAGLAGMAVSIESPTMRVILGVLSNQLGRSAIAHAVFQMTNGQVPSARDESDAIGELANVLAGRLKVAVLARDAGLRLGLPGPVTAEQLVVHGTQATLRVAFGSVPAALVVVMP